MAKHCTTNFIDQLLVKADGEAAPIWISLACKIYPLPNKEALAKALEQLITETPKLNVVWEPMQQCWISRKWNENEKLASLKSDTIPARFEQHLQRIINTTIDLANCLPFHLWILPIISLQAENEWLLAFQLHHAIGDARSIQFLAERFWQILAKITGTMTEENGNPLQAPKMTNKKALLKLLRYFYVIPQLFNSKYQQLSKRGDALFHIGETIGAPIIQTVRFQLTSTQLSIPYFASQLFFAAILAAIAQYENEKEQKLIRLRIPVDLRKLLGINKKTLENASSAIPIEISLEQIRQLLKTEPNKLGLTIQQMIKHLLNRGVMWTTLIECFIAAKYINSQALRRGIKLDLLDQKRSNTLVTTYVGTLDRYFNIPPPFKVTSVAAHTPTWGANGFTYQGWLYINFTSFNGIWSSEVLKQFSQLAIDWVIHSFGIKGELLE